MKSEGFAGHGLLQSHEEWAARNRVLTSTINGLIRSHAQVKTYRGLDLGCMRGDLTDLWESSFNFKWWGIDPAIEKPCFSPNGAELLSGWAHRIPFPDSHFDCVVFANVYEHVAPEQRKASIAEINRVLVKGGILVGQLPNPYFPIESHSRLPFMGWLPKRFQLLYWRLAPVSWEHNFYVVTIKDLKRKAEMSGFETVVVRNFNYPLEVIPQSVRGIARLIEPTVGIIPWSWQFVFRKV